MHRHIKKEVSLPYTARQLYDLVESIEEYPEFVPFCTKARRHAGHQRVIEGELVFSYWGIYYTLVTKNTCIPYHSIEMDFVRGPLQHLEGGSYNEDHTHNRCLVRLYVFISLKPWQEYLLLPSAVDLLSDRMVQIFIDRARTVYS